MSYNKGFGKMRADKYRYSTVVFQIHLAAGHYIPTAPMCDFGLME